MLQEFLQIHPKKHLIFDFDETLFTLFLPWEVYFKEIAHKLFELDPSLKTFLHGKSLNDVENEAVRRHGEVAVKLRREYAAFFEKEYLRGVEEHHALTDFIRQASSEKSADGAPKYHLYLWTTNMLSTVEPVLIKAGLREHFTTLVTKSDIELTKPEPEGFYQIFNSQTQKKEDYLMIGDSSNDAGAAKNAGIEFFQVNHA